MGLPYILPTWSDLAKMTTFKKWANWELYLSLKETNWIGWETFRLLVKKLHCHGVTCKIDLDGLRSTQWLWLAMHDNPCLVFDNLFFHRSSYVRGDAFRMRHTTYAWPRDARTGVATSKSICLKTSKSYENDVCRNCAFRVKTSERKNN